MAEENTESQAPENTPTSGADDQGTTNPGLDVEALRKELSDARAEAAKYRIRAREAAEKAETLKSLDEFNAVSARVSELETDLACERLARKYGLPDQLANRITGSTEEEREADAKALSALVRTPAVGRGGLDPSATPTTLNPAELAKRIPRGRN